MKPGIINRSSYNSKGNASVILAEFKVNFLGEGEETTLIKEVYRQIFLFFILWEIFR